MSAALHFPMQVLQKHWQFFSLKIFPVLPRGQNFGRKAQKGPKKIEWGREDLGPNF
jgi:hypothetical protein